MNITVQATCSKISANGLEMHEPSLRESGLGVAMYYMMPHGLELTEEIYRPL